MPESTAHPSSPPETPDLALILAERRAMTGSLASTIAHDINNILTVGCASADMLRTTDGLNEEQAELARDISDTFARLVEMSRRLSAIGRAGTKADLAPGDLRQVAEATLAAAGHDPRFRGCQLDLEPGEAVPLHLNAVMMKNVLMKLLVNAAEALPGQGRILVRVRRDAYSAFLEVHDSGPGIPQDLRVRVFEPFYTTKEGREGLSLLAVLGGAKMHRGRAIALESPLGGACFRLTLPLDKPAA